VAGPNAAKPETAEMLDEWRAAERALATATQGRKAAQAAATAAEQAEKAATATAAAARAALVAATAAEASAQATAAAAVAVTRAARGDIEETERLEDEATTVESVARDRYHEAEARARRR
jgi:hypothetical protein